MVVATAVAGRWLSGSATYLNASSPAISTTSVSTAKPSVEVLDVSPSVSQAVTSPAGPFEITFNQPIDSKSLSALKSSQPGNWKVLDSSTAVFVPLQPLMPDSQLQVTSVGGSSAKFAATNGDYLAKPIDLIWKSGSGSVLRMQQILAQLGFLPLVWTPSSSSSSASPIAELYSPPPGNFSWRYPNIPPSLKNSFQAIAA